MLSRSLSRSLRRSKAILSELTALSKVSTAPFVSTSASAPVRSFSCGSKKVEASKHNHLPAEYFGSNVFDKKTMKNYIPSQFYDRYMDSLAKSQPIDIETVDAVANGLLKWSSERGATHFTFWFQPIINGHTAEKHDTFLDTMRDGETPISRFTYKQLLMAEPDGSSFPSGGLRSTHVARGYTCWDPNSAPFIMTNSNGATLYIPSLFFSWDGAKSLDEKVPLLRSENALRRETLRLFDVLGDKRHTSVHTDSGLEQEFFLIKKEYYNKRPDIQAAGRTLFGAAPAKGQQMEDQYFANLSDRFLSAVHEFEQEMWKLGAPIQTRHREVAPGQYEIAPKFAPGNIATDRNLLTMIVMQKVCAKYGLVSLFHEKPFKGVNGSGKHNNWSMGTNAIPTLFQPGDNPQTNSTFMFFVAATLKAIDSHGDLMRVAISGAGNDHRLGANEAPPAIVSVYLGDDISVAVDKFIKKDASPSTVDLSINLGIPTLPIITRASTDRNRTSTFAFTGNKFEFRAVGSSQNPSRSNQVLNTIIAESIKSMTDDIIALKNKGLTAQQAQEEVARNTLIKHKRIIFNANGYAEEWQVEAAKRGLPNLKTTPDALATYNSAKNQKLFESLQVLSKEELAARSNILYEDYIKRICIEALTTANIAITQIAPAVFKYQQTVATSITALEYVSKSQSIGQRAHLDNVTKNLDILISNSHKLKELADAAHHQDSLQASAEFCEKSVIPVMNQVRSAADLLETLVDSESWPLPSYSTMLFDQE